MVMTLPYTFNVSASQNNNDIAVEWITENEEKIKSYGEETYANGLKLVKAATITAIVSDYNENYQWLDVNARPGVHYYRIRSINVNNELSYSNIVKVVVNTGKSEIVVYPNPVVDGRINVNFINQPKG